MDIPLGYAVGNHTEVWEAIQVLSGKGEKRLSEICISLAANMVSLCKNIDTGLAKSLVLDAISSGKALDKLSEWICYQGGDISFIDKPERLLKSTYKQEYRAKSDGCICKMVADKIGYASMHLGAGRVKLEDKIDYTAGIIFNKSYGDYVKSGEVIATMYSSKNYFDECILALDDAIKILKNEPLSETLIFDVI